MKISYIYESDVFNGNLPTPDWKEAIIQNERMVEEMRLREGFKYILLQAIHLKMHYDFYDILRDVRVTDVNNPCAFVRLCELIPGSMIDYLGNIVLLYNYPKVQFDGMAENTKKFIDMLYSTYDFHVMENDILITFDIFSPNSHTSYSFIDGLEHYDKEYEKTSALEQNIKAFIFGMYKYINLDDVRFFHPYIENYRNDYMENVIKRFHKIVCENKYKIKFIFNRWNAIYPYKKISNFLCTYYYIYNSPYVLNKDEINLMRL